MTLAGKTVWLIGASEGLGRALAGQLADEGCRLILSARSAARLDSVAPGKATVLPMDVTDAASVARAAAAVGRVDMLIYCAGAYEPMKAQDWNAAGAERIVDVNFLGAMRVLPHVLPPMLDRDAGHIVLIGSLSAFFGLPGAIGYGASKAALMHLAENLYLDLKTTAIRVQIVNPGFIATRLTDKNGFAMPQIQTPDAAARHVIRAIRRGRFRVNFPKPFALVFPLLRLLPSRWVRALF